MAEPLHVVINGTPEFNETIGSVDLHTSTVNYSEIEVDPSAAQNIDLTHVLQNTVGLQIQQSGGLGSFSSVSLRAASSEQVFIFLDGILLNDSVSGYVDLSLIPVNQIQRIEVFRGATPVELGSASMGGAINIITHEGSDEHSQLGVAVNNHSLRSANLHWSSSNNKNHYRLVAEVIDNQNNYPIINDNGTIYVNSDNREEDRNNAELEQTSLLYTWKNLLDNKSVVINSFRYFDKNQNLPNFNNSPDTIAALDTQLLQANTRLAIDDMLTPGDQTSLEFYLRHKEEKYDDRLSQIGVRQNHLLQQFQSYGFKAFYKNKISTITEFRFVLDSTKEDSASKDLLGELSNVKHHRLTTTANIGIKNLFSNGRRVFDAILSFESIKDQLDDAYDVFSNPVPAQNRDYDFSDLRLGYFQYFSDNTQLKINLGQYHRAPYLYELYGDRGFFHGNEDLKAEESINFDAGIEYLHDSNSILNGSKLYLGYFQNDSENLIIREYNAQGVGVPDNVEDAQIRGIESTFIWPVNKYHRLQLNITLTDTIIFNNDGNESNKIPGQFAESYLLAYQFNRSSWFYQIEYSVKQSMYYDRENLLKASDRETVNTAVKKTYKEHKFELSIENIFDNRYQDYHGYPKPGRTIFAGYTYTF